jgi:hypothetical protein
MITPKESTCLLVRIRNSCLGNIMAAPDEGTAVFDSRLYRVGVLQDNDIEPTPYSNCIISWRASVMGRGEKLDILDLRDDVCRQDLAVW